MTTDRCTPLRLLGLGLLVFAAGAMGLGFIVLAMLLAGPVCRAS